MLIIRIPEKDSNNKNALGKEVELTNIFTDNNVIDLGSHFIAYRTSVNKINSQNERTCIAVQALDLEFSSAVYLPDIFGEVYDLQMEGLDSIYISYGSADEEDIHSVHIPISFSSQEDYMISENSKGKLLIETAEDISEQIVELPKLIWEEVFTLKEKDYVVRFERTSLVYVLLKNEENHERYADYCLTVEDEEGNTIAKQKIINYPVAYEEVYWLTDFSGDGFPDIAFCTEYDSVKQNLSALHFMIWNMKSEIYEPKPLPIPGLRIVMPLWNEKCSSIIYFYRASEKWKNFSFHNGKWEEHFLTEAEEGEELNPGNITLYPDAKCWEKIEVTVGSETISKYIKKNK